jgi:DNA-binding LacI/PurR family transcriptional regulator
MVKTQTTLHLLVEPSYTYSHWYGRTLDGIRYEASRKRLPLEIDLAEEESDAAAFERCAKSATIVLVLGGSAIWEAHAVKRLCSLGVHPLLVSSQFTDSRYSYSYVTLNHLEAASEITRYLLGAGRRRIAFFGMNPDSLPDILKCNGFRKTLRDAGLPCDEGDIYLNKGRILDSVASLATRLPGYDAILCTNDIVALILIRSLHADHGKSLAGRFLTGFGDTLSGRMASPSLTTVTLDHYEAGRKAVDLWSYLADHPGVASATITIASQILVRESTHGSAPRPVMGKAKAAEEAEAIKTFDFYSDGAVREALMLEGLLQRCDDTDLRIVRCLVAGKTYENAAEDLNLSVTAVKYRIKRMLSASMLSSRDALEALAVKYLGKKTGAAG